MSLFVRVPGTKTTANSGLRQQKSEASDEERDCTKPHYASPQELQIAISKLREVLPEGTSVDTDPDTLRTFGSSENSYHSTSPHSVIVSQSIWPSIRVFTRS